MSDTISLGAAWLPRVLEADYGVAATPFIHADRMLDFHVLLYIVKGGMHIVERDVEFHLKVGDLVLLKAGRRHYGVLPCEPSTAWYYIHFYLSQGDEDNLPQSAAHTSLTGSDAAHEEPDTLALPQMVRQPPGGTLEKELRRVVDLMQSTDSVRFFQMNITLYGILLTSYELFRESASKSLQEKRVDALLRYLEEHADQRFCARNLSQLIGLSYKYLSTCFRQETGMSMHAYHARLRMDKAATMLRQSTESISEIGYALGFEEPLYFSACFKKIYGCSPKQYRTRHINKT